MTAEFSGLDGFRIPALKRTLEPALRRAIDSKTKPLGSLGRLEGLALQIGLVQGRLDPAFEHPAIVICAADHGITAENVSAYPSAVTAQMVQNFLAGGAAINVFAAQHGIKLEIVDAGVATELPAHPRLHDRKIRHGTRNFAIEPALTATEVRTALAQGAQIVSKLFANGTNVIGFGDMGIGNTSAAAILMALGCGLPLQDCVGAGTGLDRPGIEHKRAVLTGALARIEAALGGLERGTVGWSEGVLSECAGLEMTMMLGGMLRAAELGMLVLVDGFIATAALLPGLAVHPALPSYCVFTHCSAEAGHRAMLAHLGAEPVLDLGMRLGEGSGAAVAYPILCSAIAFLGEMASFEAAGVSGPTVG